MSIKRAFDGEGGGHEEPGGPPVLAGERRRSETAGDDAESSFSGLDHVFDRLEASPAPAPSGDDEPPVSEDEWGDDEPTLVRALPHSAVVFVAETTPPPKRLAPLVLPPLRPRRVRTTQPPPMHVRPPAPLAVPPAPLAVPPAPCPRLPPLPPVPSLPRATLETLPSIPSPSIRASSTAPTTVRSSPQTLPSIAVTLREGTTLTLADGNGRSATMRRPRSRQARLLAGATLFASACVVARLLFGGARPADFELPSGVSPALAAAPETAPETTATAVASASPSALGATSVQPPQVVPASSVAVTPHSPSRLLPVSRRPTPRVAKQPPAAPPAVCSAAAPARQASANLPRRRLFGSED